VVNSLTHPYLGALVLGYLLVESGLNLQDLFNEMFGLEPQRFDEPVAEVPSPDFREISGGGPEDITKFVIFEETKVMDEPGTGAFVGDPEFIFRGEGGTMEEILEMRETQVLTIGEIQERILAEGPEDVVFQNGPEVAAAVTEAIRALTGADVRRRSRVSPEEVTETTVEPTVSSSAQEAGLGVQRGFIDGVEIGGEEFLIP